MKHTEEPSAKPIEEIDDESKSHVSAKKRSLKVAAKKHALAMHEQKGHKGKKAAKIQSSRTSQTFKAVKVFCEKYLCEAYKKTLEQVKNEEQYITCEEILDMIETEEYYDKQKPTDRNVTITTETLYKKYFRSKEGKNRRWFIL